MKNLLLLFIFLSSLLSCNNKPTNNSTEKKLINDRLIAPQNEIAINTTFPFGCSNLIKYNYPIHWEGDLENYGHLKQPKGKAFEDLMNCFADLNKIATQSKNPEILKLSHIKIGTHLQDTQFYDSIAQQKIETLKYRLPDMGKYQCYYFFEQVSGKYGSYGNLLLLDPKLKEGKTLNIYYEVSGEQHLNFRYFYLDGKTIRIYEGSYYDDGCWLTEKYNIVVSNNGQLNTTEIKYK